tara:strand:- start:80145 stop:82808 length:2664 start_codon:yes stop_codon:yes gene_type:complete
MASKQLLSLDKSRSWSGDQIRSAFLNFFEERDHKIIPSASLIPEDPTVLLTIAGMLPFKPIFLGKEKPPAVRVTSSQKCIRTNDIENVGRTARHHTFFEMLGNFSFGDYFKKEAIKWSWELITEVFELDPAHLVISVFREDDEAAEIWRNFIGVSAQRIIRMDEEDNFWSSGPTGPCGPCSEIYFDFKPELGDVDIDLEDENRFIEVYNLVFMQYNRDSQGTLIPLANCNIDTGMGLERMAQILQGVPNNYETDLVYPLIEKTASFININYKNVGDKERTSLKIIADHCRAVTQLISDGVIASNLGRGYILRRLIRRMIRHGRLLGIKELFLSKLADTSIDLMKQAYPKLIESRELIMRELKTEELRFLETLDRGENLLEQIIAKGKNEITGAQAFELYDTYGFPFELTQEIAEENNLSVDIKGFEDEMQRQRQRAKDAAITIDLTLQGAIEKITSNFAPTAFEGHNKHECLSTVLAILVDGKLAQRASCGQKVEVFLDKTPFYGESGGQVGDQGELTGNGLLVLIHAVTKDKNVFVHSGVIEQGELKVKDILTARIDEYSRRCAMSNHTATHLLQSALKIVVDSSVGQRGSLVAFDRLRFDFNSATPTSLSQLNEIERFVNQWISESHAIFVKTMPIDKALEAGALAMFGEKYGDIVRVVDVPGVSMELCGGTHVANTSELGVFKIINETGIASGIRRIEAVAGPALFNYLNERDIVVKQLSDLLKIKPPEIVSRVITLQHELKDALRQITSIRKELAMTKVLTLMDKVQSIRNSQYIVERLDGIDSTSLQSAALNMVDKLGDRSAVILGGIPNTNVQDKLILIAAFGSNVVSDGLNAGKFIGLIANHCGGGGGGRPNFAQAGGKDASALNSALQLATEKLVRSLK